MSDEPVVVKDLTTMYFLRG